MHDYVLAVAIISQVATEYGISARRITDKGRTPEVVKAKLEARRRIFAQTGLSTKEVGQMTGSVRARRESA